MKNIIALLGIISALMVGLWACRQHDDFPVLKGPYLGQKPPGMEPEIFAPGIISTEDYNEECSGFTMDAELFIFRRYYSESSDAIYMTEYKVDRWEKPYNVPFKSKVYDGDFTFAPDGKTLYFTSKRPLDESGRPCQDSNIWVTEKISTGWSEPHLLGYPVNTDKDTGYPSITKDGTLYFFCRGCGGFGKADIFRSRFENGNFSKIENLGEAINSEEHDYDPFISPDESYLIFSSTRPGGYGKDDYYITFREEGGSWTKPVNMGKKFNTPRSDNRPYVTPDGKYLFFSSSKSGNKDIYWVDAKIIESFRPLNMK